jgi:hypothetical protein
MPAHDHASSASRAARIAFLLAVNVAVLLTLLEALAVAYHFLQTGQFFYGRRIAPAPAEEITAFAAQSVRPLVHPYFGFNYLVQDNAELHYNNHGFLQAAPYVKNSPGCCEFPSRRAPDELIVGIFGGSVAQQFALRAQGSGKLAARLQQDPALAGKRIRILNFASGGYKQPQQLLVLTYYLSIGQPLDVVLNIDGFNELLYGKALWDAGADVSLPGASWPNLVQRFESEAGTQSNFDATADVFYEYQRKHYADAAERCRFGTCWLLNHAAASFFAHRRASLPSGKLAAEAGRPRWFFTFPAPADAKNMDVWDFTAARWADASVLMRDIAAARQIAYLHVLQPNRFLQAASAAGRTDNADEVLRTSVPRAFTAVRQRIPALTSQGVAVLDASAIFADLAPDVYGSDCCHLSDKGDDLMADVVGRALAPLLAARSSQPRP